MLSPKDLAKEVCEIGNEKVSKTFLQVFVSAILAGIFIGLGYYGYLVFMVGGLSLKFFAAVSFSTGIMMIVIAGGELFTGNCLITFGLYSRRYNLIKVLKNLSVVFLGNMVGSISLALFIYLSKQSPLLISIIDDIVVNKISLSFFVAFFRAILCNILVSVGVYMSYAAKTVGSKILALFFPIFLFVVSGYEHVVANMFILPLGLFLGSNYTVINIIYNLIPVTLGNIVGGAIIIPIAYSLVFLRKCEKLKNNE